jgi:DNA-binding IclR family transcriptional regulator
MTAVTSTDNPILEALRNTPGATVAELAEKVGVARSTAGKALQALEGDGLVRRTEGGGRQDDGFRTVSRQ